ncbi:MAG: 50S ribosomal protein L17 [Bacteroidales bacterium]|nr:50S ribosomal protein L17 [Bacteroidales bacterium]
MRHNRKVNHLGRTSSHRKAMLANMATSLIMHKRIKTTVAKARALRIYVEPLLTKSKEDSTHSRRVVFSYLQNKEAVTELFREVSPKIMERPGGYTRILKIGTRVGDSADMCYIELVDYNENLLGAKSDAAGKAGKRRRRGSGKKKEEAETTVAKKTAAEEKVKAGTPAAEAEVETAPAGETTEEVVAEAEQSAESSDASASEAEPTNENPEEGKKE